jgi:hypothetical protein
VEVAGKAGLVGRKRVLDSTPIYDAVATQGGCRKKICGL